MQVKKKIVEGRGSKARKRAKNEEGNTSDSSVPTSKENRRNEAGTHHKPVMEVRILPVVVSAIVAPLDCLDCSVAGIWGRCRYERVARHPGSNVSFRPAEQVERADRQYIIRRRCDSV